MKVLHVVRHAKAVNRNRKKSDFKRSLTKKGVKEARAVARRLQKEGFDANYMISSPANRALETAHVFAKRLNYPVAQIEKIKAIYDAADNASLLSLVRNIPATASGAFLFGHDPSFSDLAKYLIEDFDTAMPKGAVVTIAFDTDSWAEVGPGKGQLLLFDYPMNKTEKARRINALSGELAASITAAMKDQLQGVDPETAKQIGRYILKLHSNKKMRKVAERILKLAPQLSRGAMGSGNKQRRDDSERQNPGT